MPTKWDLWVKAKRGYVIPQPREIDTAPLSLIRSAGLEELTDPQELARIIENVGLSSHMPDYFPEQLQGQLGTGLQVWQYPKQLAPYLCLVAENGVDSYLEIGTQHGGTFALTTTYLRRLGQLKRADAVDFQAPPALAKVGGSMRVHTMNSVSPRFRRLVKRLAPLDLVMIDGDHSEIGCMLDFKAVRRYARMVAFHDICDPEFGVKRVWEMLKAELPPHGWDYYEFTSQYPDIEGRLGRPLLGIGVLIHPRNLHP